MDLEPLVSYGSRATIALSGLAVITGVVLVKTGRKEAHKKAMVTAALLAVIFVILYILRTMLFEHGRYEGDYRTFYLFTLGSHTVMSLINLPLAVVTIYLGFKGRIEIHKRIAPYTAVVWIYVAFTGWLVFLFNS